MLNVAYTKNQSMRESLAKVWGLDEGKSPFQKEEEKPLTKTMTGQKPTKVMVEPKMEKKVKSIIDLLEVNKDELPSIYCDMDQVLCNFMKRQIKQLVVLL